MFLMRWLCLKGVSIGLTGNNERFCFGFICLSSLSLLLFGLVPQMESMHVLSLSESEVSDDCYRSNI